MENLLRALEITKISRKAYYKILNHYSLEQLNKVPEGFQNNLFWNIAHIVVTQQLLVYGLSDLELMVSDNWVKLYKKGSKTQKNATEDAVELLKELLFSTIEKTEEDVEEGTFKEFKSYMTSTTFEIKNLEDAFEFNNFHEGIHLGYILALKKSLIK